MEVVKDCVFAEVAGGCVVISDAVVVVTEELASEIKKIVKRPSESASGYWIPRKNIIFKKWIKSDMWWPDYQLKLFRRGKGSFDKNQVHKPLKVEGETEKLEMPLIHNNYSSISQFIIKLNNYTDIEAENLSAEYEFNWLDAIRFPINDFVKTFFLQKGYQDGLHGLVLSMLQAFYMEVVFAKLWEKREFKEVERDNFVEEVGQELKNSRSKIMYWIKTVLINKSKNSIKKIILKASRKIDASQVRPF